MDRKWGFLPDLHAWGGDTAPSKASVKPKIYVTLISQLTGTGKIIPQAVGDPYRSHINHDPHPLLDTPGSSMTAKSLLRSDQSVSCFLGLNVLIHFDPLKKGQKLKGPLKEGRRPLAMRARGYNGEYRILQCKDNGNVSTHFLTTLVSHRGSGDASHKIGSC